MNFPLYYQWLRNQFPNAIPYQPFPFCAFTTKQRCVIGAPLSRLNELRRAIDVDPLLPKPFTVFFIKDQEDIPYPPPSTRWFLVSPEGIVRYERDVPQPPGPLYLPDFSPAPTDPASSCTTCAFSVYPCRTHVYVETETP